MALELASGARETASVAGNVFTLLGEDSSAISFLAAITKTAQTVNGSTVYCRAFNSTDPSEWEVMQMTYASAGDTLTRVSTIEGSNGASAVSFSGNVTIYRVITENDLTPRSVDVLQKGREVITTGLASAVSSTSYAAAADNATVTPSASASTLMVHWSASGVVARDGTSGSFAQARISGAFVNASSTRVETGAQKLAGLLNFTADTDLSLEFTVNGVFELSSSNVNSSGDWEFGINYLVTGSVMDLTVSTFELSYEEYQ